MKTSRFGKIRIILFALILMLTLSACSTSRHDTRESTALILPPVIQYEKDFYLSLADEAGAGQCPAHIEFGKDYVLTRDKLRIAKQGIM